MKPMPVPLGTARVLRFLVAIALVVGLVFSTLLLHRPPDPSFEGRPASEWAQDLLSPDYNVRSEAQVAFKAFGEPAVPQLRLLLKKRNAPWENHLVRLESILPFWTYRPIDSNACRERGAEMLGLLGGKAQSAIPDLVDVLGMDPASTEVERALVRIGPAAVVELSQALTRGNGNLWIRFSAARLLREFKPGDQRTIAALIRGTRDRDARVRAEVARSLGAVAGGRLDAVTALLPLGADPEVEVRAAAMAALGTIGLATAEAVAAVENGLIDSSSGVEIEAARALWLLRRDADLIVPVLTEILSGKDRRWQAAYVLGEMGPDAAAAAPALVKALQEERVPRPFRTPPSSAFALGKIGRAAIPHLSKLLSHPDAPIRMGTLLAFGIMGMDGREAVPDLIVLLKDRDAEVRHTAALTLAAVGAAPDQILTGLADCLGAEDVYMRSAAAAVLRKIAPDGEWVLQPE